MKAKNIAVIFDMYKKSDFDMYTKNLILIPEWSNCDLNVCQKVTFALLNLKSLKLAYLDSLWNSESKYI